MDHGIKYSIKTSPKAKRLRIVVNCDAQVSVITPKGFDAGLVDKYIESKARWIKEKMKLFHSRKKIEKPKSIVQSSYHACNARAKKMIKERLMHFNDFYNFEYNRISVKKQSTKWGSCSGKKNLNFNYKVLFLSQDLADYIIVHELCHLKEMNHSHRFWQLVEKTIPDYKKRKKKLNNVSL